jgi:hypothetical protein
LPRILRCVHHVGFPCQLKIEQRTPRGVIYVTLPDQLLDMTRKGVITDRTEYPD